MYALCSQPRGLLTVFCFLLLEISWGNRVDAESAWETKARKRSQWQRELESAIAFNFVLMLNWRLLRTNVLTNYMTAGDLDVCLLTIWTNARLSMWNYKLLLYNKPIRDPKLGCRQQLESALKMPCQVVCPIPTNDVAIFQKPICCEFGVSL